ncbi:50S ribosomal protein L4 [Leadbettera azotonutricia]|uniref:Large ribosomal subunit protein uL4 n=1 Tax=Leadbettera azotonutricia (strain ATCC BAA-888 / DSM 13862 / ZAS-9) TaxID=545695 RepID=F5YEB8_LEAAZ|nr:50S ribosomal protein L4 [Leadbettera azotonutricia]AEF83289.1 ribosomal protein, L4/L1 family [Leadbettera azotonutricia ZAS-9]
MNCKVYSTGGKEVRSIELADAVFGLPINEDVIWYAINNELANKRQGNASTKDRGEVHGSNAKPYKQKGTGRARRGDKKSPIMVGGGVVFGPKPRDFSYSMPKKAKQLAIKTILSLKVQSDMLKIVEDFTVESGKTKDLLGILKNFGPGLRTVLVLRGEEVDVKTEKDDRAEVLPGVRMIKQAGNNISWLSFLSHNRLRAHDLFYGRSIIMTESAAKKLNDFYAAEKAEGAAE